MSGDESRRRTKLNSKKHKGERSFPGIGNFRFGSDSRVIDWNIPAKSGYWIDCLLGLLTEMKADLGQTMRKANVAATKRRKPSDLK
jgi:hypothetical protein